MKNLFSQHGGFFHPGTVSHGTMRSEDLLVTFADEYERLAPFNERPLIREAREIADKLNAGDYTLDDDAQEIASEIVHELFDALDRVATAHGCYFGSTEGDNSDYGFWEIETEEMGGYGFLKIETEETGNDDE